MNGVEIFWNNIASFFLNVLLVIISYPLSKAGKNLYQEAKKKVDKLSKERNKAAAKKLRDKETLTKEQVAEIVRLFQVAINYLGLIPHKIGQSASGEISSTLYMMKGPVGDLWREIVDKQKQEVLQKVKEKKP